MNELLLVQFYNPLKKSTIDTIYIEATSSRIDSSDEGCWKAYSKYKKCLAQIPKDNFICAVRPDALHEDGESVNKNEEVYDIVIHNNFDETGSGTYSFAVRGYRMKRDQSDGGFLVIFDRTGNKVFEAPSRVLFSIIGRSAIAPAPIPKAKAAKKTKRASGNVISLSDFKKQMAK
jgi:hypothetical protein